MPAISGNKGLYVLGGREISFPRDDIYYLANPAMVATDTLGYPTELEWRRLPIGYTRAKAIRGTVSEVDCGFSPCNQNFEITVEMAYIGGDIYEPIMTTPYKDENTNITRILRVHNDGCIIDADSSPASSVTQTGFSGGKHLISFGRKNGIRYGIRDLKYNALSNNITATPSYDDTLRLFGSPSMITTIYRFFAKVNDIVVSDLLPCVRNSDKVPGFYDFASNRFITSADGGASLIAILSDDSKPSVDTDQLVWVDGIHYNVGYKPDYGKYMDYSSIVRYDTTSLPNKMIPYILTSDLGDFTAMSALYANSIAWTDSNLVDIIKNSGALTIEYWSKPYSTYDTSSSTDGGKLGGLTWTNQNTPGSYYLTLHGNTGGYRLKDSLAYSGIGNRQSATRWIHFAWVMSKSQNSYIVNFYHDGRIVRSGSGEGSIVQTSISLSDLDNCTGVAIYPKNTSNEVTAFTGFGIYNGVKYFGETINPVIPQIDM